MLCGNVQQQKYLRVIEHLVESNADVNYNDRWGGTPLRDAVREGHMECARILNNAGGELGYDEVQASGELCELARQGSLDLLKVMLSCGVMVNAADYDKRTCLHLAASEVGACAHGVRRSRSWRSHRRRRPAWPTSWQVSRRPPPPSRTPPARAL